MHRWTNGGVINFVPFSLTCVFMVTEVPQTYANLLPLSPSLSLAPLLSPGSTRVRDRIRDELVLCANPYVCHVRDCLPGYSLVSLSVSLPLSLSLSLSLAGSQETLNGSAAPGGGAGAAAPPRAQEETVQRVSSVGEQEVCMSSRT